MRIIASLFMMILLIGEGAAQTSRQIVAQGVGVSTCGQFAKSYRNNPRNTERKYFDWAQGFMTGMNWSLAAYKTGVRDRNLGAKTIRDQLFFLRNYCDRNPLKPYVAAVFVLYESLPFVVKRER